MFFKRCHIHIVMLTVVLSFLCGLSACGPKTPTWQEQYDLGVRYLSEGNYEEAIIAFNAAIEIDPKKAETYLGLYDAYVAIGDYENAQTAITTGRKECGDNAEFDAAKRALDELLGNEQSYLNEVQMYEDLEELSEALRSGVLTFDDMPEVFSTPFNQLGNFIGMVPRDFRNITTSGTFRGIEYDNLELQSCNYAYEDTGYGPGWHIRATAPLGSSALLGFYVDCYESFEEGRAIPTGWKGISIGDSMETVLSKLGLDPKLSKYSSIDIHIREDTNASTAWVDTKTWGFVGDTPVESISILFYLGADFSSDNAYYVGFDFMDGGPLSGANYTNNLLYSSLVN